MQNCELCGPLREKAFWKNSWFYAIDASTDEFPCFIRIVCARHVAEMSELTKAERTYLWALLEIAEETMISYLSPDKINYAQFGNMVPHLHWHLIARWKDDPYFPKCPWGQKQRNIASDVVLARRAKTDLLIKKLPAIFDQLPCPTE